MRTTVDLPADIHRRAASLARDRRQSLSRTLADLVAEGLGDQTPTKGRVSVDQDTGLPTIRLGRVITTDDVRALDDEV